MEFTVKACSLAFIVAFALTKGYAKDLPTDISAPFYPLCLEDFYGFFGEEPKENSQCIDSKYSAGIDVSLDSDNKLTAFAKNQEGGFVSYTIHDTRQPKGGGGETFLLTATLNSGGTGSFGSLMLVQKMKGSKQLNLVLSIQGGDRCNDGYLSDAYIDGASIFWSSAATPFRLLNPIEIRDERMARLASQFLGEDESDQYQYFAGWKPYDDVENSAAGCAGSIKHEYSILTGEERIVGIELNLSEEWGAWPAQNQGKMRECLASWRPEGVAQNVVGSVQYNMDEWQRQLQFLLRKCSI